MMPTMPDLASLVAPHIGQPYEPNACWPVVWQLYQQAWDLPPEQTPGQAIQYFQEIWFRGDTADPLIISQPWDLWILRHKGLSSRHVGIVLDPLQMVHTREHSGLCLERLRAWRSKLLQIARLQQLL